MKVLFISNSKSDAMQLWYSSGCHLEHIFEHMTVTTIDDLFDKVRNIEPDVVVVGYNVGGQLHSGVDIATLIQEDFSEIVLFENTSTQEESFIHRGVKIDSNVGWDPEKLALLLKNIAA